MQEKIRCQQLHCQMETSSRTLEHVRGECSSLAVRNKELEEKVVEAAADRARVPAAEAPAPALPTLELGREVLAVKDRLVELERENAVLSAENGAFKSQVQAHKEQVETSGGRRLNFDFNDVPAVTLDGAGAESKSKVVQRNRMTTQWKWRSILIVKDVFTTSFFCKLGRAGTKKERKDSILRFEIGNVFGR